MMITVVDSEDKLRQATEALEEMMQDALIVLSDVEIIRLVRGHSLQEAADAGV